jgi:hypothetical protein
VICYFGHHDGLLYSLYSIMITVCHVLLWFDIVLLHYSWLILKGRFYANKALKHILGFYTLLSEKCEDTKGIVRRY